MCVLFSNVSWVPHTRSAHSRHLITKCRITEQANTYVPGRSFNTKRKYTFIIAKQTVVIMFTVIDLNKQHAHVFLVQGTHSNVPDS